LTEFSGLPRSLKLTQSSKYGMLLTVIWISLIHNV